ncbi:hypothetical protein ACIP80_13935 [Streptomyces sp. NPDC088555]|uniref:hypothetical protein n=1 Tax=Streptomyces sp. NPDC088555 TaxID=3365866 RepID=UPI00380AB7DA
MPHVLVLFGEYPEFRGHARAHRDVHAEYAKPGVIPRGVAALVVRSGRMGRRVGIAVALTAGRRELGGRRGHPIGRERTRGSMDGRGTSVLNRARISRGSAFPSNSARGQ